MLNEEWKDIKDYEGLYQVSNRGSVKSLSRTCKSKNGSIRTVNGRLLKPVINKYGYYQVILIKEGSRKTFTVHRLVAAAFIPKEEDKDSIDHIDTNRLNNTVKNLRWCTNLENSNNPNSFGNLVSGQRNKFKAVLCYDKNGILINEFSSINEAERITGAKHQHIGKCCKGKRKFAGGYCWKYKDELEKLGYEITKPNSEDD